MSYKRIIIDLFLLLSVTSSPTDGRLISGPRDTVSKVNESAYFNCSTTDNPEDMNWIHGDDKNVYNYRMILKPYNVRFEREIIGRSCNLVIRSVQPSDAGKYTCSEGDLEEKRPAHLIVLVSDPVCRSSIKVGGDIEQNKCNMTDNGVELTCSVTFYGKKPALEWKRVSDNRTITDGLFSVLSGNNYSETLKLQDEVSQYNSSYVCQITNTTLSPYKCDCEDMRVLLEDTRKRFQYLRNSAIEKTRKELQDVGNWAAKKTRKRLQDMRNSTIEKTQKELRNVGRRAVEKTRKRLQDLGSNIVEDNVNSIAADETTQSSASLYTTAVAGSSQSCPSLGAIAFEETGQILRDLRAVVVQETRKVLQFLSDVAVNETRNLLRNISNFAVDETGPSTTEKTRETSVSLDPSRTENTMQASQSLLPSADEESTQSLEPNITKETLKSTVSHVPSIVEKIQKISASHGPSRTEETRTIPESHVPSATEKTLKTTMSHGSSIIEETRKIPAPLAPSKTEEVQKIPVSRGPSTTEKTRETWVSLDPSRTDNTMHESQSHRVSAHEESTQSSLSPSPSASVATIPSSPTRFRTSDIDTEGRKVGESKDSDEPVTGSAGTVAALATILGLLICCMAAAVVVTLLHFKREKKRKDDAVAEVESYLRSLQLSEEEVNRGTEILNESFGNAKPLKSSVANQR